MSDVEIPNKEEFISKKTTAGICGILIGGFGVHRFIIGDSKGGIIRILIMVFIYLLFIDKQLDNASLHEAWYMRLRIIVSLIVILALSINVLF